MPYLTPSELEQMGFAQLGRSVQVSTKASIYGASQISLADFVRIDDFALLSAGAGGITLGPYVHIGCHSSLIGQGQIVFGAFSGVSGHCAVYSSSADWSGRWLASPTIPADMRHERHLPVIFGQFVAIGAHSVVLPGITLVDNVGVIAQSLVRKSIAEAGLYGGSPFRRLGKRSEEWREQAEQLLRSPNDLNSDVHE